VELRDNLFGTVSGSFHVIRVPGGASRHPDSHNTWNNLRGAPHNGYQSPDRSLMRMERFHFGNQCGGTANDK
jgi:hypothetical protein